MRKSLLVRLVILFLMTTTFSGCIWAIDDNGHGRGGGHGDGGGHHEEHHDRR
jgi:hypothetical protein